MANPNGGIKLSTNFELASSLPLDSRLWVQDLAGLNTIDFKYQGLIAFVEAEGKHYFYDDPDWNILNDSTGSLPDAPSDGEYYVRKDGFWVSMPSTSLLFDVAPFNVSLSGTKTFGKYTSGQPVSYTAKTLEFILKDIAQETLNPVVNSPSISIVLSVSGTFEIGTVLSSVNATVNVNRGSISPVYNSGSPYRAGTFNTISVNTKINGSTSGSFAIVGTDSKIFNGSFTISSGNNTVGASGTHDVGATPVYNSAGGVYLSALSANTITASTSVTGAYKLFYGDSSFVPDSSTMRTLPYNRFTNSGNTFTFNTGSTNRRFTVWMPSTNSLVSVIDVNTNANLTGSFILSSVSVVDGSLSTPVSGKMYFMENAVPFTSHVLSVVIS